MEKKIKKDKVRLAKAFAKKWKDRGSEKSDTQVFWNELLSTFYDINVTDKAHVDYEVPVVKSTTYTSGWKDVVVNKFSSKNQVLIEQKSCGIDLSKKEERSGKKITPFEQAKMYDNDSPRDEKANWIILCNFQEFWIYDLSKSLKDLKEPTAKLNLEDLPSHLDWLAMLDDGSDEKQDAILKITPDFRIEEQLSFKAGQIVGELYDELKAKYIEPDSEQTLKSLNILCVRLVFCLYAEDAGLFDKNDRHIFYHYLSQFDAHSMRKAIIELFQVLDTPKETRDKYLDEENPLLSSFPYVNGGLFHDDEPIEIPMFTPSTRELLLEKASKGFHWEKISPTIFGAVFESTLNPSTRRNGGMHYTSIENIHKVIDPLFLDELKAELDDIMRYVTINKDGSVNRNAETKLLAYQKKLASLTFLDPASGSGNFLTETYLCLRRLENQIIKALTQYPTMLLDDGYDWVKVSIQQLYGIEINDFACSVAKTALWIAESQMFQETQAIINGEKDFLPLHTFNHVHEGNALTLDWNDVIPASKLNFIMGNPPFLGFTYQSKEQKSDLKNLFPNTKSIDYVCGWWKKASDFIQDTKIEGAFVSTNSITQGELVSSLWNNLNIKINFAYRTFVWNSEANLKAHVHCVIIGFANFDRKTKIIYDNESGKIVKSINPYLIDGDFKPVKSRGTALCNVPKMVYGNMPRDYGYYTFSKEEKDDFVRKEPLSAKYFYKLWGSVEYLHNKPRYILYLKNANIKELKNMKYLVERINHVKQARLNSKAKEIQKFANTPLLFAQETQSPDHNFIIVPIVSSQRRKYIPMGFMSANNITNSKVETIPDANIYHFGILESSVHMSWMRTVCMRLKSDYSYSKDIVYNNFPWPTPTKSQRQRIEQTAQAVLDARELYPDASLSDMYDPDNEWMYPELIRAHNDNDEAVMNAYGFSSKMSEIDIVAELFKMYQILINDRK